MKIYNCDKRRKADQTCRTKISVVETNLDKTSGCGGTGTDSTIPTNTVQVPITTGTVTDSSSECTDFIGDICRYIYRTGEL